MARITIDFVDINLVDGYQNTDHEAFLKKLKAKEKKLKETDSNSHAYLYDLRNGIYCIEPKVVTLGEKLNNYLNYLNYLNQNYANWNPSTPVISYLDCGLVPVSYAPSFYADWLNDLVVRDLVKKGLIDPIYIKGTSVLQQGYVGATKDVWVKRSQLAKVLNCPEEFATCTTLVQALINAYDRK